MQNIYITEWIKVLYDATVASSLSRERWDTAKKREEYLGTLQESQGRSFVTTVYPRDGLTLCSVLMTPNSNVFFYSPIVKKYVEITKHKKNIPVISRLQRAVNINNRNVQVESVGWRFPHALRATWELHASVHEPTRGTSLFQICVTAFAYISILSPVLFSCSLRVIFFSFSFLPLV